MPSARGSSRLISRCPDARSEFRGKNVLLVDDSIVRGTTSTELVQMARDAGATKVRLQCGTPDVIDACYSRNYQSGLWCVSYVCTRRLKARFLGQHGVQVPCECLPGRTRGNTVDLSVLHTSSESSRIGWNRKHRGTTCPAIPDNSMAL